MTDECPDFEATVRTMLDTPPVVRPLAAAKPQDDGDDQIEADEEDEGDDS